MQRVCAIFAFALFLTSLMCGASSAQQVQSMKLLTQQVGWARSGQHLYWTTDHGAHWKDIAPPKSPKESIGGIFFLDTSKGWVLLSHPDEKGQQQFRIASTNDAGTTWSSSPIRLPWKRYPEDFAGGGSIFFLDRLRGWVDLDILSASLSPGRLLATDDGGKTWKATPSDPGRGGSLCFFGEADGVLAGGPDNTELYVTHDASKSWQQLALKAPAEVAPDTFPTYGKPVCQASHGFVPVTFSGPDGSKSALVLFSTGDSGKTWRPDRVLSRLDETPPGQVVPTAVVGADLLAFPSLGHKPMLTVVRPGGTKTAKEEGDSLKNVLDLSFVDVSNGWALTFAGLSSTTDRGASWTDITPGTRRTSVPLQHLRAPNKRGYEGSEPLLYPQGFSYLQFTCTALNYPQSFDTQAFGVNDAGQISGSWDVANDQAYGFVAVPQTP